MSVCNIDMGCVCHNDLNIRQSIDGAGESTFMKDVKLASGIQNYSIQDSTDEKMRAQWSRAGRISIRSAKYHQDE